MLRTNLKILLTVIGTLAVYTAVANMIPQVQSEVPEETVIGADVTPEQLVAIGQELYEGAGGCAVCHGLGTRAPDLLGVIGQVCGDRREGLGCKEYILQSLTEPNSFVVEGFQPIMPDLRRTLSEPEIWALVAFLQSQGGPVTVTAADIPRAEVSAAGEQAIGEGGGAAAADAAVIDPVELLRTNACFACHQLGEEGVALGPAFETIGSRGAEYIRRSILLPYADTAQGFETVAGTMPANFGDQLTAAQLEAIVRFLSSQR
jgi:mono/diheme cytochrome c family protein